MKKVASLLCALSLLLVAAEEAPKTPLLDDLVRLHVPMPLIKKGKIEATPEQFAQIVAIARPLMHEQYNPKMNEIFGLERRAQRLILQGKTKEEVRPLLTQIAALKLEALEIKIDILNAVQGILTPEQWEQYKPLSR